MPRRGLGSGHLAVPGDAQRRQGSKCVPASGCWGSLSPRCRSTGSSFAAARPARRRRAGCGRAPCRRHRTGWRPQGPQPWAPGRTGPRRGSWRCQTRVSEDPRTPEPDRAAAGMKQPPLYPSQAAAAAPSLAARGGVGSASSCQLPEEGWLQAVM